MSIVLNILEELLVAKEYMGDIVKKGQFKRGNVLIPYVDYKFNKASIETIVLNPYVKGKDDMFKLGIEELLWNNQMEKVGVFSSGIPIRKYN